jgi:cytochrome P450
MSDTPTTTVRDVEYHNGCPVLPGFDPLDQATVNDPSEWLDAARREVPVFYVPEQDEWIITRFETLQELMLNEDGYSMADGFDLPPVPKEIADQEPDGCWAIAHFAKLEDPPAHTRLRRLYAPAFSLKQAMLKTDEIRALTHSLVDEFIDLGAVDLVPVYCSTMPIRVICNVIGAPQEDAPRLYEWAINVADLFSNPLGEARVLEVGREVLKLEEYITALVEERRRSPREDDFVTKLLTATLNDDGSGLSDREAVGLLVDLTFAGSDTSASSLGIIVRRLLSEPSLWENLLVNPQLLDAYVEEGLRIGNPIRGALRVTKREVQIGGVTIPKGAKVRAHTWAASFDEREFPDPKKFDPSRPNVSKHITFGRGAHMCPGANLARREITLALETLADRLPSLRLTPGHQLDFDRSQFNPKLLRGLFVEWDERSA